MVDMRIDFIFEDASLFIEVGLAVNVRSVHFSSMG